MTDIDRQTEILERLARIETILENYGPAFDKLLAIDRRISKIEDRVGLARWILLGFGSSIMAILIKQWLG